MACPAGLEPATFCLEGRCSIQLSYGHTSDQWIKLKQGSVAKQGQQWVELAIDNVD